MSRPTPLTYKTRNWRSYSEALKRRGSLTIWFDPTMTWVAAPTGKRGRQPAYSDAAIQTCVTMKVLFGKADIGAPSVRATMSTRQRTGLVESLLRLIGLDRAVPDFSTLSRRQKTVKVNIAYPGSDGPLHLLSDNEASSAIGSRTMPSGIKVEEEGEGPARHRSEGGPERYHRRSRAETKMHFVELLGQRLSARDFDRQIPEFEVRVAVLNGFTALGTPITDLAGEVCPGQRKLQPSAVCASESAAGTERHHAGNFELLRLSVTALIIYAARTDRKTTDCSASSAGLP